VLGNPAVAAEIMESGKGIGGVVNGTGFNACNFNICGYGHNLEIGHLKLGTKCDLDREVSEKAGIALDIESCVSGKILGNVLKLAVSELAYSTSLCELIDSMDKDKLNALIFSVGFGGALPEEFSSLSEGEKTILIELCSRFAERAATYMAAILGGISRKNNGVRFLYEGSVFEKNPAFVASVNQKCGGAQPILINSPKKGHPLSFFGAIYDVTAKSTLATLTEWEPVYRKVINPNE
jgi:hexokinase